ncbi:MAG: VCBS repeat-containing protein [Planctomycetales bacterium]|nr:VCBS repeat-containing protein [Planctomycetales bacterium]
MKIGSAVSPPAIDILDAEGRSLAVAHDVRYARVVAHETDDYFIRLTSQTAYGPYTVSNDKAYSELDVTVSSIAAVSEAEPNNTLEEAAPITSGEYIQGRITQATADVFSFSASAGQTVVVTFSGLPEEQPVAALLNNSGEVNAVVSPGGGILAQIDRSGTYYLTLNANPEANEISQEYFFSLVTLDSAVGHQDQGNVLDSSISFAVDESPTFLVGSLDDLDDKDFFVFETTGLDRYVFDLSPNSEGNVAAGSQVLSIYDDTGNLIEKQSYGNLNMVHDNYRPYLPPGRYFLSITASTEIGLGAYAIEIRKSEAFPTHRDVPLFYLNLDGRVSADGIERLGPFTPAEAHGVAAARFQAWFNNYDIDLTLQRPSKGAERVSVGLGRWGTSNGGVASGVSGLRRPRGDATVGFPGSMQSFNSGNLGTAAHEAGHGVGQQHVRNPLSAMAWSYTRQAAWNPVGAAYAYDETPRDALPYQINPRDYFDQVLQPGRIAVETEPNDDVTSAESIDGYFSEMRFDLELSHQLAASAPLTDIVAGDFNGDGRSDLAAANRGSNQIDLWLGDGRGYFELASSFRGTNIKGESEPLAKGDLNRDGIDDLTVANGDANRLTILSGGSDGVFSRLDTIRFGNPVQASEIADFDSDGILDVLATVGRSIKIMLGNGDGTFKAPRSFATTSTPYSIAIQDFNSDGNVDVATANRSANQVQLFLGNGNGSMRSAGRYAVGNAPRGIAAGDFDLDGDIDLIVANYDSEDLSLLFNEGNAAFSREPLTYPLNFAPESLFAADVNTDNIVDIALGSRTDATRFLLGKGDGSFSEPVLYKTGSNSLAVEVGDFNQDGRVDIATTFVDGISLMVGRADVRNDRVTIYGNIRSESDQDVFQFTVDAGQTFDIDIDAAEFQSALDAEIWLYNSNEDLLSYSLDAIDRDSNLRSVDPHLTHTFNHSGEYTVRVAGHNSVGRYRLKITPLESEESIAPRVLQTYPKDDTAVESTRQIVFWLNDQIDVDRYEPADMITVVGNSTGAQTGVFSFDPLTSLLIWTADQPLRPDQYSVTLHSDSVKDLRGNSLDGETDGSFEFPQISGNGVVGGDLQFNFRVSSSDSHPARLTNVESQPTAYNRWHFRLKFDDDLDILSVQNATFQLRSRGADRRYGTQDDMIQPLDRWYSSYALAANNSTLHLYTRGYPDPGPYRVESSFLDAAGYSIEVSRTVTVDTEDHFHGPSVIDVFPKLGNASSISTRTVEISFSGAIEQSSINRESFRIRYSPTPMFFDGNDSYLEGTIDWVGSQNKAVFSAAVPLPPGHYLVELDSGEAGIFDIDGRMLDGEFLNSNIAGSLSPFLWLQSPSGDGAPGGDFRAAFSIVRIDIDGDGTQTAQDIDALCLGIRLNKTDHRLDVNQDDIVDILDFEHLIENVIGTTPGDSNLDRHFDSADLIQVFIAGSYEDDNPGNSTWSTGDWNCDGEFDTRDLVAAFAAGDYVASAKPIRENTQALVSAALVDSEPEFRNRTMTSVLLECETGPLLRAKAATITSPRLVHIFAAAPAAAATRPAKEGKSGDHRTSVIDDPEWPAQAVL